jgi:hypothetical protein
MTQHREQKIVQGEDWWEVEHLRITSFHLSDMTDLDHANLWDSAVGKSADQILRRPGERLTNLTSIIEEKQLVFEVRPNRADWLLRPSLAPSRVPIQGVQSLGKLSSSLGFFNGIADKWLAIGPGITRLAFGASFIRGVPSLISGNQEISKFLKNVVRDEGNLRDFSYQVNRPRRSTFNQNLVINRLAKWSVLLSGTVSLAVGPNKPPTLETTPPETICQLVLDINTAAEQASLIGRDEAQALFKELVSFGREIAVSGDVA